MLRLQYGAIFFLSFFVRNFNNLRNKLWYFDYIPPNNFRKICCLKIIFLPLISPKNNISNYYTLSRDYQQIFIQIGRRNNQPCVVISASDVKFRQFFTTFLPTTSERIIAENLLYHFEALKTIFFNDMSLSIVRYFIQIYKINLKSSSFRYISER